jgi:eukaryotic-like serine/threonine-protein kinase
MSSSTPVARANGLSGAAPGQIGQYRVIAEKCAGAFGTVYHAEDSRTGQPVAIRVLPREVTDTATVAETIRRRSRTVIEASQAHPSLTGVLEYGSTEDGHVFAVMERVEGRRLSDVLAEPHRIEVAAAVQRAIEFGGPIETLHNLGLVHAGVRPSNFVLAPDDSVKLLDVELAALRDVPALQHLIAERSPAAYLAPEQIAGQVVSEKTDVYAFGVLLYEMLSGAPPFEAESREEAFAKHSQGTPPLLRDRRRGIPIAVEATLAEVLDKIPERRPFMQEVLNQIATDGSAGPRPWKRLAAPAAGLVAAVSIGLLVAWSLLTPRLSAQVEGPPPAAVKPPPAAPAAQIETSRPAPATALELPPPATPARATEPATGVQRPPLAVAPTPPPPAPALAPARPPAEPSTPPPASAARVTPFRSVTPSAPPPSTTAPSPSPRPVAAPPAAVAPVAPTRPAVAAPAASEAAAVRPQVEISELPPASVSAPPASAVRARDSEEADPRALIDWLLNKRGEQ